MLHARLDRRAIGTCREVLIDAQDGGALEVGVGGT
jgi:hypothetical protein